MTRLSTSPFILLSGAVTAAVGIALIILITNLQPPAQDIQLLLLYMGGSSIFTVGGVYVLYKRRWLHHLKSLRWTLLSIILLTVSLVFANVLFTLRLMYISHHDVVLTTALLIFAGIIAVISAMLIASSLIERIHQLAEATERLAHGQLNTRVQTAGNDELAQLATMFNEMAAALETVDHQKRLLEQSRRDLVAWASHDLRTPLAAIRAMNEAMLDGVVTDPETVRRYRQQIHQELQHLGQLIDDLFEIAQMDAGHLKLNRRLTALPDLIATAVTSINARASEKAIEVVSEIEDGLPLLDIAPDKIQRVLYNLIDNALHHTPSGGRVTLSARRCDPKRSRHCMEISVHNTGSTIAPEDLPHVFERFYRGERSRARTSSGYRGTGLGLAIAHGFVEAHGGTINAHSTPESGTTFTFTLV